MTGPKRTSRVAELDALRGIAVILVLVYHYTTRYGELFPAGAWGSFMLGRYGVHLFFVISGFVIFMTLDRSVRSADFVVARFSRLYPAYWTGIAVTSAVLWVMAGPLRAPSTGQAVVNLTMLQNFFHVPSVDGVYWSLEVELLFYALALVAFRLRLLGHAEALVAAWLVLSALFWSPLWAAYLDRVPGASFGARILDLEFAPLFSIGILLYRRYRGQGNAALSYALLAVAAALVFLAYPLSVALMIVAGSLVLWQLSRGGMAFLRLRPLLFLGAISYSLYLVHQKIGHALMFSLAQHGWSPWVRIAAAAAASLALATAITFLIERPAMAAIRRWYRRSPAREGRPSTAVTRVSQT